MYQRGRTLPDADTSRLVEAAARHVSSSRPVTAVDVGSGTGRFTPALARAFGAAVGVEPSDGMRGVAVREATAPGVSYVGGRAEALPLASSSCGAAWVFLVLHHVDDLVACGRELGRVLQPGGMAALRSVFPEWQREVLWQHFFPGAKTLEEQVMPSLARLLDAWRPFGLEMHGREVVEIELAPDFATYVDRIATRAISLLEALDDDQFAAGMDAMRAAAEHEPEDRPVVEPVDLLLLRRI